MGERVGVVLVPFPEFTSNNGAENRDDQADYADDSFFPESYFTCVTQTSKSLKYDLFGEIQEKGEF